MSLTIIDAKRVQALLPMKECIDVMAHAMAAASAGEATIPPRLVLPLGDHGGAFFVMPAASNVLGGYGAKLVSLTAGNPAKGLPAIRGLFVLFDKANGEPVAVMDAASLTAIRTAAAAGLATRLLARADARTCGIFGTGVQAATHIEAMCAIRPLAEIRVWGRDFDKTTAWAVEQAKATGGPIVARRDPSEVAACDIICTVTASPQPILKGEWVKPGAHVNLVGAHGLAAREADSALIAKAAVYVDLMESARNEAGDVMIPIREGVVSEDQIQGEIGQLVTHQVPGRASDKEITLYKSVGVAAQDLYAGWHVYRKAQAQAAPDIGKADL